LKTSSTTSATTRSEKRRTQMRWVVQRYLRWGRQCSAMRWSLTWHGMGSELRSGVSHSCTVRARLGVRALCSVLAPLGHCQTRMVVSGGWRELAAMSGSQISAQCALGSEGSVLRFGSSGPLPDADSGWRWLAGVCGSWCRGGAERGRRRQPPERG
jgi:hypothetical protein